MNGQERPCVHCPLRLRRRRTAPPRSRRQMRNARRASSLAGHTHQWRQRSRGRDGAGVAWPADGAGDGLADAAVDHRGAFLQGHAAAGLAARAGQSVLVHHPSALGACRRRDCRDRCRLCSCRARLAIATAQCARRSRLACSVARAGSGDRRVAARHAWRAGGPFHGNVGRASSGPAIISA